MSKETFPAFVQKCSADPAALARQTHLWANAFFDYLHTHGQNSELTALVIRCYVSDKMYNDIHGYHHLPQQCFVRGYETDALGQRTPVAVPVTRAVLRASDPYAADLLDWDPECNWIGGYPGRFNSN
jgi:hypothetical protein